MYHGPILRHVSGAALFAMALIVAGSASAACPVGCPLGSTDPDNDNVCNVACPGAVGAPAQDNCLNVSNPNQFDAFQAPGDPAAEPFGNVCNVDYDQNNFVGVADFILFAGAISPNGNPVFECADPLSPVFFSLINLADFVCFVQAFGTAPGP
jgi:hypothetical protein